MQGTVPEIEETNEWEKIKINKNKLRFLQTPWSAADVCAVPCALDLGGGGGGARHEWMVHWDGRDFQPTYGHLPLPLSMHFLHKQPHIPRIWV